MKNLLFREIRRFLPEVASAETRDRLHQPSGATARPTNPRQSIYLVAQGREDPGLKVRERRFDLKTRFDRGADRQLLDGKIVRRLKNWIERIWSCRESINDVQYIGA